MKNEEKDFGSLAATEDAAAFANPAPDAASHAAKDDGGFAFPVLEEYSQFNDHLGKYEEHYAPHGGMSLRDYFAIHGDQPGQLEIAAEAGVVTQEHCGLDWGHPDRSKYQPWAQWFHSLPQEERYRLYAAVRYKVADAMLKERAK